MCVKDTGSSPQKLVPANLKNSIAIFIRNFIRNGYHRKKSLPARTWVVWQ
jgi:hypothetical protein